MPVTVLDLTADKDEANAHLAPEERAELAPIWTDELGFVRDDRGTWEAHALPDALGIAFATHESADDATTFAFVTALEDGFVVVTEGRVDPAADPAVRDTFKASEPLPWRVRAKTVASLFAFHAAQVGEQEKLRMSARRSTQGLDVLVAHLRGRGVALWRTRVGGIVGLLAGLPFLLMPVEKPKDLGTKLMLATMMAAGGFIGATFFSTKLEAKRATLPPIETKNALPYRD
ncbi:MAG TPA: hypothetical protein VF407_14085 [Polyangiaceae bacterium]